MTMMGPFCSAYSVILWFYKQETIPSIIYVPMYREASWEGWWGIISHSKKAAAQPSLEALK